MAAPASERVVHTTCNRDCPDACGIAATVQTLDDGSEKIVRLQGQKEHPITRGFLCYRTSHFLEQQNAPDRVLSPHIRRDGQLQACSWDDALDHIASQMRRVVDESGPSAIFHYRSGGNLGVLLNVTELFWQALGPVAEKSGDICTGALDAAQDLDFGGRDSNDIHDLENARHVILWGRNVFACSPHTVPILKRARAGKMKTTLTTVDPTYHRTSALSDVVIQPRPAQDFALAMAVAHLLFATGRTHPDAAKWCANLDAFRALCESQPRSVWQKLADVDDAAVEHLANALASGPTTVLIGWGMGRRRAGGAIVRAIDALCAITGNIGERGASASFYFDRKRSVRKIAAIAKDTFDFAFQPPPRTVSEPLLADALDATTTRLMWVTAGNPVAMLPGSARIARKIEEVETVVVVDTWWSDTAKLADVVLPCATLLERNDVVPAYGHHYIGRAHAVLPPAGEAKTDVEILQALAPRLGLEDRLRSVGFFDDDTTWLKRFSAPLADAGVSLSTLEAGAVRSPLAPKIAWKGRRFATTSGQAELVTALPAEVEQALSTFTGGASAARYPLSLLSLSHPKSQSSQWVTSGKPEGPAECTVHPQAAEGYLDGEVCRLQSAMGEMVVRLKFDANQRPDVALVPKGGAFLEGKSANTLVRPAVTDIGEGGALYDEGVRLQKAKTDTP